MGTHRRSQRRCRGQRGGHKGRGRGRGGRGGVVLAQDMIAEPWSQNHEVLDL